MKRVMVICGLVGLAAGAGWGDGSAAAPAVTPSAPATPAAPATQPTTAPAGPKESAAVRVNGFDFQAVAPTTWLTPTRRRPTTIHVLLRITNRGDKDLQVSENLTVVIKDATGGILDVTQEIHYVNQPFPARMVKKGESVDLECPVKIWPADKPGTYRLMGPDFQGGYWQMEDVTPGRYTLSLQYENGDGDAAFWNGKALTKEMTVEIAKPAAVPEP